MDILRSMDKEYIMLYQIYISKIARVWAGIPPYIFTKDGFIIFRTFRNKRIPYQQVTRISTRTIQIPGETGAVHGTDRVHVLDDGAH